MSKVPKKGTIREFRRELTFDGKYVCTGCFEDEGIREFIMIDVVQAQCSFCDESCGREPVARFTDVVEHIQNCLFHEYDDAVNWMYLDSDTREPMNVILDASDVLEGVGLKLPRDDGDQLLEALIDELSEISWSEQNPFGISPQDQIRDSWERFCEVVKHERRYFFEDIEDGFEFDANSPGQILTRIFEYAEEIELFETIPADKTLFRARYQKPGTALTTALDLGPPPVEAATQPNRMSPPGIPMFYASDEAETALRETVDRNGTYALGFFKTLRDMTILNLKDLPPTPSLFQACSETSGPWNRILLRFLNHVAREISAPIDRDNKVHIEYVPTQVVTEFVRSKVSTGDRRIDGIKFESSLHAEHACYVIFATQHDLVVPENDRWGLGLKQWLKLIDVREVCASTEWIFKRKSEPTRSSKPELSLFDCRTLD